MISAQEPLREIFRRENRSFLQYISQASPWVSYDDRALAEKLHRLAAEEQDALQSLAEWMEAKNISLPYLGAFPTVFANYNFVSIRKLLKPLLVEQRKELADLEAAATALTDKEARAKVDSLVDLNRKHLRDFEQMSQPQAA